MGPVNPTFIPSEMEKVIYYKMRKDEKIGVECISGLLGMNGLILRVRVLPTIKIKLSLFGYSVYEDGVINFAFLHKAIKFWRH